MTGPHAAVAAVRGAVRTALADLAPGTRVLVAVSGGADSMALASATAFVAGRFGLQHSAVIVDHQLQVESTVIASQVAARLDPLGFDPVVVQTVVVGANGGPEGAARTARYEAIEATADEVEAEVVLLGHTLDDQAESVLLGLSRGSGARSISGMSASRGRYRRPMLAIRRDTTRVACDVESLTFWDDPHNDDESFTRVRVRHRVMPVIESELGPGIAEALARTAALVHDDDDALQAWADEVRTKAELVGTDGLALDIDVLVTVPAAVRRRVIRTAALERGVPGGDLRASHVSDVDALVGAWKGQGEVHLPGGIRAWRSCGRLLIARPSQ
jgi:tRNA(Ile)-lysidine synthase